MTPRGLSRTDTGGVLRSRRRSVAVTATFAALVLSLSGCSWREGLALGWPNGITPEAQANHKLWLGSVIAALVIGVIVWGLMFWTAAFHRKKQGDEELPRQFGYNMPLELVLTVIPFVIVSVLFYFTVVTQNKFTDMKKPEVIVDVTAFQWNWKFGYQKVEFADGTFDYDGAIPARSEALASIPESGDSQGDEQIGAIAGKNPEDKTYLKFDKIETLGTSDEIPVLVLPVGKRIEFEQASADVIHSFWVPEFLFKRDVFPNPKENHSENIWQVAEINRTGAFVGRCAEMCGTYHAMMNFEVRVVEPDAFKDYLAARTAGMTNAEALKSINEEPFAVTTRPFDTRRGEQVMPKPETAAAQATK